MILDNGICSVFSRINVAAPGNRPQYQYRRKTVCYYGELDFETSPAFRTADMETTDISQRIRIQQDRSITRDDVVVLDDVTEMPDGALTYRVRRAWHGLDDDGMPISDLSLEAYT